MSVNLAEPTLPARLISKADIARLFEVKVVTVGTWIRSGRLPAPIRIGRRPYWTPQTVARLLGEGNQADVGGSPLQATPGIAPADKKGAKS